MAEFLTMEDAKCKFGSKGKTNAGLTLGIIGTALAALNGNNGCGGNGILGGLFGGNGNCAFQAADQAKMIAMSQGQIASDLAWSNRVQSMQDDLGVYENLSTRINNNVNNAYEGRIQDLQEKSAMYVDLITRDDNQNLALCRELSNIRTNDVKEKSDMYIRLSDKISELEKREAATQAALPLMFELSMVKANKYTDDCCCAAEKQRLVSDAYLQRQLDHKIDGQVKLAYSELCAGVPSIAPLYCSPFTTYGMGNYAGTAIRNFNSIDQALDGNNGPCCNRTNTL